ncbi:hypothetical protein KL930_001330 [Ogataea haglerorum]|uniref:Uncharacterized protein n=1 Tax=Ogataea haglerorum TaxID=1937702 RepID=A0AAN6HZL4_9ASCO|nr:uncharacterized protein KL911_003731 [Ogataea haglerorum]KAG7695007.1 hypothetical protein KL915_003240 [Ogataea haglerorum]KAG7698552.1 hypothetical protein KL951_001816 [Ogataea haglerorum]KAG7706332.1 hypothetical protein KL914_003227 [Ogataea haglerorum]KAG7707955.1 hypothetical protein KL950_002581 [Ogataea haglerorum]KAG7717247.1 hypothetical protein KL913_002998 [Ogataea haglerorum]
MSTEEYANLRQQILSLEFERDELVQKIDELKKRKVELSGENQFNLQEYLQTCQLLQDHSNLPSVDMEKRLQLIKMFYPHMVISDVQQEAGILSFTLKFKYYLEFKVVVEFSQERVVNLDIAKSKHTIVSEMAEINKLIRLSCAKKDLSLFIYATNSYINLAKRRLKLWTQLFDSLVAEYNVNDISPALQNDRLAVFARFKNCQIVTISKGGKQFTVHWKLAFDSDDAEFVGEFQSKLECMFTDGETSVDLDDTFNVLVKVDGIAGAISHLLKNLLD